ncbi:Arginyl-tRNA--protein transferase 1 [Aphelenchoides fujianensis]|nr:Arginyl-tRNA--protein transferase 1 [Aphelenchoides fujianensis]
MEWLLNESLVQLIGMSSRRSRTSCGYCKSSTNYTEENDVDTNDEDEVSDSSTESADEKRSVCLGVWGFRLSHDHYQQLVDRNWRRSGRYLYKPINDKTCCPLYTIRLDANVVRLSRSQKRVLRVWSDFLKYDKRPAVRGDVTSRVPVDPLASKSKKAADATPPNPQKDRSRKKKTKRVERALERLKAKNVDIEKFQQERRERESKRRRTLESFLPEWDPSFKHKLEIRTVRVGSAEFEESEAESFALYQKYQQIVHGDFRCSHRGFRSFLVDSPFLASDPQGQEGSYHQLYLIDGRIVAVGVIDILPRCLSSAYLFYDPAFAFLNLGTYSALREIAFVREMVKTRPQCHYYYLGYFVFACRKMRYKGGFKPSELLCERSREWASVLESSRSQLMVVQVPLPECLEMIEANGGRFTIFRPHAPPAAVGNEWNCRPLKYEEQSRFERVTVDAQVAHTLRDFARHFGPLSSAVYVVI